MIEKIKIILDTDIGTDIDDAVALAYLLCQKKCQLEGITTVSGEAEKRAMLADVLCKIAGQQIPIHSGCTQPMRGIPQRQKEASHAAKLYKYEYQKKFEEETAVDFLYETIKNNPHEIVLLTIGPLTNIGKLFEKYPKLPGLLKAHYIMAGAFYEKACQNEWNILCDPHAAKAVFTNPVPVTRVFGLNVTLKVKKNAEVVRKEFDSRILKPVLDFAEIFFEEQKDYITFHDPLAAAAIFDSSLCQLECGNIEIVTKPGDKFGATIWEKSPKGKIEIAVNVNVNKFFAEFFSKTGNLNNLISTN